MGIKHCQRQELEGRHAWPDLIVFETCGICDQSDGAGSESAAVRHLEDSGYFVFFKTRMNTDVIHKKALQRSERLQRWLDGVFCAICEKRDRWPLTTKRGIMCCFSCAGDAHTSWVLNP